MNSSHENTYFQEVVNSNPTSTVMEDTKSYEQTEESRKNQKLVKNNSKVEKKEKIGWNPIESKRYLKFLVQNQHLLELQSKEKRRLKLNVKMSKAVKSRDGSQCHSHHQKMMLKYGSVTGIINSLQYLKQEKTSKCQEPQKVKEQEVNLGEYNLQDFDLNLNWCRASLFDQDRQLLLQEIELMGQENYQHNLFSTWDDCFI